MNDDEIRAARKAAVRAARAAATEARKEAARTAQQRAQEAKKAKERAKYAGPLMEPGLAVPDMTGLAHGVFDHIKNPLKRAFLRAYSLCGRPVKACQMAGLHLGQPYRSEWKNDKEFQDAYALAKELAAAWAEDEVFRRAVEGDRRYEFNKKTGEPLLHPDMCDCGHHRYSHEGKKLKCHEEGCACYKFESAPYYTVQRSDRLLEKVLQARLPEEWSEKRQVEVRGLMNNLDVRRLPPWAINRIADGDSVAGILMELTPEELARATAREPAQLSAGSVTGEPDDTGPNYEIMEGGDE